MQVETKASERFLEPIPYSEDCVLSVHCETDDNNADKFTCVVTSKDGKRPRNWQPDSFGKKFLPIGGKIIHTSTLHTFEAPVSSYAYALISKAWKGKVNYTSSAYQKVFALQTEDILFESRRKVMAQFMLSLDKGESPSYSSITPNHPCPIKLNDYQQLLSDNALILPYYHFLPEMGCGKTGACIHTLDRIAAQTYKSANRPAIFLLCMPKNILTNWEREISRFSSCKNKVSIIRATGRHIRETQLVQAVHNPPNSGIQAVYILVGYDAAIGTPLLEAYQYDALVIDESHNCANPSTERTKFFIKLRDRAKRRYLLTGTPVRNTPFDMWPQLEILSKGLSGFHTFKSFKDFYGVWDYQTYSGRTTLSSFANIPMLQELVSKVSFRITKKQALPFLPSKTYDFVTVDLQDEQKKIYKQLADQLAAEFELIDDTDYMTVNNHLTKMLRLAQITSGYAVMDQKGLYRFDPNPKVEELVNLLKEKDSDQKTLVWCAFEENIKQIHARLNIEGIKSVTYYGGTTHQNRDTAVKAFNCDPEMKVFIGHPGAGGVGLNLLGFDPENPAKYSTNCDHVIYYSRNWSAPEYWQSQDRANRFGTRVKTRITNLVVDNSIDTVIYGRVEDKTSTAENMLDIRQRLKECLGCL